MTRVSTKPPHTHSHTHTKKGGEGIPSVAVGVSGDVEQTSKPRGETVTLMRNDSNLGILFHCNHPYIT